MRKQSTNCLVFVLTVAVGLTATRHWGNANLSLRSHVRIKKNSASGADIAMLGNSILGSAVDVKLLSERMGMKVVKLLRGGAASAYWYLVLKNRIVPAEPRPQYAVVCFRDMYLTRPRFRVHGKYGKALRRVSTAYDPNLERLAYGTAWSHLNAVLKSSCATYRLRQQLRLRAEHAVTAFVSTRFLNSYSRRYTKTAARVFRNDKMVPELLAQAVRAAENVDDRNIYDFERNLKKSFLPMMIEISRENDIELILVRMKRWPGRIEEHEELLQGYVKSLKAYLEDQDVPFIDFSDDKRMQHRHYKGDDHFSREGKLFFTEILAEALEECLGRDLNPHGNTPKGF